MPNEDKSPISRRLKTMLANHFAAEWTLRTIEDAFEGADVPFVEDPEPAGGQRRAKLAGYLNGLDWAAPGDVRKFLNALAAVLKETDRSHEAVLSYRRPAWSDPLSGPEPEYPLARLLEELRRCGWEWKDGAVVALSQVARLADAKAVASSLDLGHLGEHVARIERSIETDPGQAIGSAKELVETVAKTILNKRGVPFGPADDLLTLGKAVFKQLKQVPDDVPDAAKGAASIKRTLSNLASVVQGVAELRGLYGTGHGKDGKAKGPGPRHARLVVGAAATLAYYWFETDKEQP